MTFGIRSVERRERRSAQLQLVEPRRERVRREERDDPVPGRNVTRFVVAPSGRFAEDARRQPDRIDHPEFTDAEARIKGRLSTHVVAQRRIRNFHDQQRVGRSSAPARPVARG